MPMPSSHNRSQMLPAETSQTPLDGRLSRLRVRHMQLLDQIDRTGSLTAAARVIGVSQPAATTMLREVEEAFGYPLIERSHRGGRLNAAGTQVLSRLRVALNALDAATVSLGMLQDLPFVRIGILPLVGIDALCSVVRRLEATAVIPRLEVQMGKVGELLKMLTDGAVDCVVSFLDSETGPEDVRRFRVTRLWEERLVIVASARHRFARRRAIELNELLEELWVLTPTHSANRRSVERLFLRNGLAAPQPRVEASSFHVGLGLAAASSLLTVVPESAYRQFGDSVRELRVSPSFRPNYVNLMTLRDVPPPAVVGMLEAEFKLYAQALQRSKEKSGAER